jgi:hypothetical protein
MQVNLYRWPDGSIKVSFDGPGNKDLVPLQVVPSELQKADVIQIDVSELKK